MHTEELEQILTDCKKQDRSAQFKLYKLYSKAMYNICHRMMNEETDAEDALQEAFVKAFANLNTYKYDATFGAWLKRIVINTCISKIKKRKMLFTDIDDKDFVDVQQVDYGDVQMDVQKIQRAVSILPEGYRVIFSMYALEGYDHQEIADVMGISVGTSKSQYSRAKVKIKEILSNEDRAIKAS